MHIEYATAHKWTKPVAEDPLVHFGKNSRARMRATLKRIPDTTIRTEIRELDEAFLDWFLPLYHTRIGEKKNPVVFDIYGRTLGKPGRTYPYYALSLFEDDAPLGGTIFSMRDDRLSIAYRTYAHTWRNIQLQANPSLFTEYVIAKHAFSEGKKTIVHGKDRNPYGLNSDIGLGAFKLSVGCSPELSKVYERRALDTEALSKDAFILEYPATGTCITNAHLIISRANEEKYAQVTKYPERLAVTVAYRD